MYITTNRRIIDLVRRQNELIIQNIMTEADQEIITAMDLLLFNDGTVQEDDWGEPDLEEYPECAHAEGQMCFADASIAHAEGYYVR